MPIEQHVDSARGFVYSTISGIVTMQEIRRHIGVVRARLDGSLLLVGRLAIAPDRAGEGIGTTLLAAVERRGDTVDVA